MSNRSLINIFKGCIYVVLFAWSVWLMLYVDNLPLYYEGYSAAILFFGFIHMFYWGGKCLAHIVNVLMQGEESKYYSARRNNDPYYQSRSFDLSKRKTLFKKKGGSQLENSLAESMKLQNNIQIITKEESNGI